MKKKLIMLIVTQWLIVLLSVSAFAYTGESDLEDTIRALKIMAGQTNSEAIQADDDLDGDGKIGLGEAIYRMQDAAGIPFVDLQAQDYEEDFLLSALDLEISKGERQEIVVLDTPRVGLDDQAFNREDLVFTTIKGETVARVEIENPTDSVEDTRYYIRGLSQGVAVFQISYDGYAGQMPLVAVNVKASDAAGPTIETDITLTKYDIVYFTGKSVNFTFSVSTDKNATVTSEVNGKIHNPVDGKFTVSLINGYNPIVITATGSSGTTTKVLNIRAKRCAYSIVNQTRPNSNVFYEGDIVTLDFTGLIVPVPKVSRIYNPAANRITYDCDMPRYSVITGDTAQYKIENVEMELTAAGTYNLANGHIDTNWFGSALYSETPVGTSPPVTDAGQTDKSFSILPDIQITVVENSDYNPELFTIALQNTEEIWPGDEVVITIPDLDIETIDADHPVDPIEGWWIATLIDSYTFFATDIPGLGTVTSDHVEINAELEELKTIKFVIPEDTEPGTYHVRGGYVWVKHGPNWWTRTTYYYKGMIPDLTIEVKKKDTGQPHGEVSIQSDQLKSRLAVALGKGEGYTGNLTTTELNTLTGELNLSASGITDADMAIMQYLTGVTAINLSNNPDITSETARKAYFDWTLEKTLDFSGCTGITTLADVAFYECTNLKAIVLPDTMTHIGEDCFSGCTELAAITLPASLKTIGDRCFFLCKALTQITIPDGVTALGEQIFGSCLYLVQIDLPANLVTIGTQCFDGCIRLAEISLPESVYTIGEKAFRGCSGLRLINFPASLRNIGNDAFLLARNINIVDARGSWFTTAEGNLWAMHEDVIFLIGDDAQLNPQSAELKMGMGALTITHQIPDSETVVWGSSNPDVATVENGVVTGVQSGIAYIYAKSTSNSYSGYCIVTVTESGKATLSSLKLSGIDLNETFNSLSYAYTADIAGDVRSTNITLQISDAGSTLRINGEAVSPGVAVPVDLTYPETIIEIKVTSADTTATKTYAITITMAAVTEKTDGQIAIGNPTLKDRLAAAAGKQTGVYTENLTKAELSAINGSIDLSAAGIVDQDMQVMPFLTGVANIDLSNNTDLTTSGLFDVFNWTAEKSLDFSGCTAIDEWPDIFKNIANLTGIVLPETVKTIADKAFEGCTKLSSVEISKEVNTIGASAFKDCSALSRIDLPEGLVSLGQYCFQGSGLKEIVLPSSLTTINQLCFFHCKQLTLLTIPAGVTEIGEKCFKGCETLAILDLRATNFISQDAVSWNVPDTTFILYKGTQSAGLNMASATVNLGEATITLTNTIPDGQSVEWYSSNTDVAMVSADGVVTGITAGTAYIYVRTTDGTYMEYCKVTFVATQTPGLTAVSFSNGELNEAFDSQRFYYTVDLDSNVTQVKVTANLADNASTLKINGVTTADATASDPVGLSIGDNIIRVGVTTESTTKTYLIRINVAKEAVSEGETSLTIASQAFTRRLAKAAGKEDGYTGPLAYTELAAIQGTLDLSGLGLTDAEMVVMKYLTGVSAIDLSGNTALTNDSAKKDIFDWTTLTSIDFSGCTGITAIAEQAFYKCNKMTEIVLPDSVTTLGDLCFSGCSALTSIDLPSGLEQIGRRCFQNAIQLASITLPASVTSIGKDAFAECKGLTEADLSKVPAQVLAGSEGLFRSCSGIDDMKKIKLPAELTSLPESFFSGCTGIAKVELPDSITSLGEAVFNGCTNLEEADLTGVNELGVFLFSSCTSLTTVTLKDGITSLPPRIFNNCTALETIELPDSITEIGMLAFDGCTGLTAIELSDNVTTVGIGVFRNCSALTSVRLSSGITILPDIFFQGCSALAEVALPESVTTIGRDCFQNAGITWLALPASVTEIYRDFITCNALAILDLRATTLTGGIQAWRLPDTTMVLLPGRTDAGLSATELNLNLGATVTLTHVIPGDKTLTWVSSNTEVATVTAEGLVTAKAEGSAMIAVKAGDDTYGGACLVNVAKEAVSEGETSLTIASQAFTRRLAKAAGKEDGYTGPLAYTELAAIQGTLDLSGLGLTDAEMVVMKYLTGVSAIDLSGNTALTNDSAKKDIFDWTTLTSIDFSGCTGITAIAEQAFYKCNKMTEIVLPDSVTTLGDLCFSGCSALTSIDLPSGLEQIGKRCFQNARQLASITLPASVTSIGKEAFAECKGLTEADLSKVPAQALAGSKGLFSGCSGIDDMKKIKLPAELTSLPEFFFWGCTGIAKVELPDSITSLGEAVFAGCTNLEEADLTGVNELGVTLFSGCTSLATVTLKDGITSLPPMIFNNCTALETIELPDSITEIGMLAFDGCTGLTAIELSDNVTTVGVGVFRNCSALTSVRLSSGIAILPEAFFQGCSALAEVALPESVTTIGRDCFQNAGITWLALPASVTEIYRDFITCNALAILDLRATTLTGGIQAWRLPDTTMVLLPGRTDAGLSATELNLNLGATVTLTHVIPGDKTLTWVSSNTEVATVTAEGLVTAKAEGSAMIAVKAGDDTYGGACLVNVATAP